MVRVAIVALSIALSAASACASFSASDEPPADGGSIAETGPNADVAAAGDASADVGTPACRTKPFGPPVAVPVGNLGPVRSYRPWIPGRRAVGGSNGTQIFAADTNPAGAPTGVASPSVLDSAFYAVNHPMVTEDGLSLFVQGKITLLDDNRLWVFTRAKVGDPMFGSRKELPLLPNHVLLEPWVLNGGTTLYFDAIAPGTSNEDLYVVRRDTPESAWGVPVPLAALNRSMNDGFPVVTPDELVLFYASTSPVDGGKDDDIWMSTRSSKTDEWGPPVVVDVLNSSRDDHPTWISDDGCTLYLSSDRVSSDTLKLYRAVREP